MILHGRLLHDPLTRPEPGWVEIEHGRIVDMQYGMPKGGAAAGGEDRLVCPGFIDAHLHLPQIDAVGCDGMDLLDWLDRVIFPAEMCWQDESRALLQIRRAHQRLLRAGTLGYAAFLTSHSHAYSCLARAHSELPLRAIAGQVLMNRNAPSDLIRQQMQTELEVHPRLAPSINPRFAIACDDEMLSRASHLAGTERFIQTHLCESRAECAKVAALSPDDPNYASVYDRHSLLTPRTLLAHGVHLSDAEWRLIATRQSVVVHCPTANTFLRSGVFNLDAAREHGVRLALGSDIAAGADIAMPRVARAMIETAKVRAMCGCEAVHLPTPAEVWRLITQGNGEALAWPDAGRLAIGAAADLLVLRPPVEFDDHLIGRLIYNWRDDFIEHRIVNGALITTQDGRSPLTF